MPLCGFGPSSHTCACATLPLLQMIDDLVAEGHRKHPAPQQQQQTQQAASQQQQGAA